MKKLVSFLSGLILLSCNTTSETGKENHFKDTVLKKYIAHLDSTESTDTDNYQYRIIKAYSENDTVFFKQMNKDIDLSIENRKLYPRLDTCIHLPKLNELNAEEVFRFSHSQSFCYFHQVITIARNEDSVWLHYVEYGLTDDGKIIQYTTPKDTITVGPCKIVKEFRKELTYDKWIELEKLIASADYWNQRTFAYQSILDGSFWTINAYTKRPRYGDNRQFHSVERNPVSPAFIAIGNYLLKISGEKTMCGDFF